MQDFKCFSPVYAIDKPSISPLIMHAHN
jgi:hypothetical protein